jgi:hypothetical protein
VSVSRASAAGSDVEEEEIDDGAGDASPWLLVQPDAAPIETRAEANQETRANEGKVGKVDKLAKRRANGKGPKPDKALSRRREGKRSKVSSRSVSAG